MYQRLYKQHIMLSQTIPKFYQSDELRNCIKYVACYGRAVLYYIDIQLDSLRALPQHIND